MKAGIIGGGFGLRVQAPIMQSFLHMELTAVATMGRHRIQKEILCKDIVHYHNWKQLLEEEDLDVVFISTTPNWHYAIAKSAIEQGIHVVCEKPFTMDSEQSNELLLLSEKLGVKVCVDFEWRFLPVRQRLKEMLEAGAIGNVLHLEYHVSSAQYDRLQSNEIGWMGKKKYFGGMLGALGSHMLDCVCWLTEAEVSEINGFTYTHVPDGMKETRDADDAFFIHGVTNWNTTFSIQLISGIHHAFGSRLIVYGDTGTLMIKNDKQLFYGKGDKQLEEMDMPDHRKIPDSLSPEAAAYYPAFFPFLERVHAYIAKNELHPDLPTALDGHINMLLLDKVLR